MSKEVNSLGTILLVVFVVLKLTGNINWSWVWVLSPFWVPASIVAVVLLCFFGAAAVGGFFKYIDRRRQRKIDNTKL